MAVHVNGATSPNLRESVIIIDAAGLILRFDGGAEHTFGYPADEVVGRNVRLLMPEPYQAEHDQYLADYRSTGEAHIIGTGREVMATRKNGSRFPAQLSVTEIEVDGTRAFVGILRDITAQVAANAESHAREIALEAVSKTVSELSRQREEAEEREFLNQQRFEAVVANTPSAISVRDLQHRYTMVNEAFCQLFGKAAVEDVIGKTEDEILPPAALECSRRAAVRILTGKHLIEEESITLGEETISVMTQRFPLHNSAGETTELVTIRTDITHRKRIEHETSERALWEERVWAAIGNGTLLVYSQPIVDIATREKVAEELLIRLGSVGSESILNPNEFLPQCEKYGLMPVIDRYMVGCAIDLARTGRAVSVNITGQTIGDPAAMTEILAALTAAGPDATDKIHFEITETIAIAAPKTAKVFSQGMRELGCRVSLDDFGTGYGAFTELRNLHLDILKIDQSFVQHMLEDAADERAVKTIIVVAKAYGLTTIAEGVESEAVLEKLAELGADRAQGYLFSKPQPIV
ncbi:MAG: EAL domain-containing protein [Mycobacterium sp.]